MQQTNTQHIYEPIKRAIIIDTSVGELEVHYSGYTPATLGNMWEPPEDAHLQLHHVYGTDSTPVHVDIEMLLKDDTFMQEVYDKTLSAVEAENADDYDEGYSPENDPDYFVEDTLYE